MGFTEIFKVFLLFLLHIFLYFFGKNHNRMQLTIAGDAHFKCIATTPQGYLCASRKSLRSFLQSLAPPRELFTPSCFPSLPYSTEGLAFSLTLTEPLKQKKTEKDFIAFPSDNNAKLPNLKCSPHPVSGKEKKRAHTNKERNRSWRARSNSRASASACVRLWILFLAQHAPFRHCQAQFLWPLSFARSDIEGPWEPPGPHTLAVQRKTRVSAGQTKTGLGWSSSLSSAGPPGKGWFWPGGYQGMPVTGQKGSISQESLRHLWEFSMRNDIGLNIVWNFR